MPTYTVLAQIVTTRSYTVMAIDQDQALEIVREDHEYLPSDLLESSVESVEVTDSD